MLHDLGRWALVCRQNVECQDVWQRMAVHGLLCGLPIAPPRAPVDRLDASLPARRRLPQPQSYLTILCHNLATRHTTNLKHAPNSCGNNSTSQPGSLVQFLQLMRPQIITTNRLARLPDSQLQCNPVPGTCRRPSGHPLGCEQTPPPLAA